MVLVRRGGRHRRFRDGLVRRASRGAILFAGVHPRATETEDHASGYYVCDSELSHIET